MNISKLSFLGTGFLLVGLSLVMLLYNVALMEKKKDHVDYPLLGFLSLISIELLAVNFILFSIALP